jgi:hypothetical protein
MKLDFAHSLAELGENHGFAVDTESDAISGAQPAGWACEGDPLQRTRIVFYRPGGMEQQQLDIRSRSICANALAVQTRRDYAGLVENEQIVRPQQARQLAKTQVKSHVAVEYE